MKKILTITKNDDAFVIMEDKEEIIKIKLSDLMLSGKDLYFNLFNKFPAEESIIEVKIVNDETIVDSNDKRITEEIKKVIESIAKKITEKKAEKIDEPD